MGFYTWYQERGFDTNPFTIRPQDDLDAQHGQDEVIKEVTKLIGKRSIILITGVYGTGKTTILQGIINKYGGKRKVIYYNCNTYETKIDFSRLIKNSGTFMERLLGTQGDIIMMLDETQNAGIKDMENLYRHYKSGDVKAIVLVAPEQRMLKLDAEMKKKAKVFRLKPLGEEEAVNIIEKRLRGDKLIPEDMVKEILKINNHPRQFLMNCEDASRFAIERESESVEMQDIDRLKEQAAA